MSTRDEITRRERARTSRRWAKRRSRRFRQKRRRIVLATLLVVCLIAADAAYALYRIGTQLYSARDHLQAGADAFRGDDLVGTRREFEAARSAAGSIANMRTHPGFVVGMFIPFIGADVRTLEALARATDRAAEGAVHLLEATEVTGSDLATAFYADNRFDFAAIADARPFLGDGWRAIVAAGELLRDTLDPRLEVVADALRTARERVWDAEDAITQARVVADALPPLLGAEGERRYLLMFQTPSEARGSGGLFGLYGVLRARDGRIDVREVEPIRELMRPYPDEDVTAPEWFTTRYERFDGLLNSSQANLSAHFPTVAKVMLRLAGSISERRFDGVIAMDPVAMGHMFGSGSISARGLDVAVTKDNVADVLLHDIYDFSSQERQERYLSDLVDAFWSKLEDEGLDPVGVADAVTSKHLKWYSTDPEEQDQLLEASLADDFTRAGRNVQFVFHNNRAVNKVDYFLHRSIDTDIELTDAGEAFVTTKIELRNEAPEGPRSTALGPGLEGDPPGMNRMYLNTVLPLGARILGFSVDGTERRPQLGNEAGYPVAWDQIEIGPGEVATVHLDYYLRAAFDPDLDVFTFSFYPHASVRADDLDVSIRSRSERRLTVLGHAEGEGKVALAPVFNEELLLQVLLD